MITALGKRSSNKRYFRIFLHYRLIMISIELRYKGTAVPIKFFKYPNRFIPGNPSLKKFSTLLRLGFFWKISRFSVHMTKSYLSDNSLCRCIAHGRDFGGFLGEYLGFHGGQRRDTSSLKEFKGREGI